MKPRKSLKEKQEQWKHRATHMVATLEELGTPVVAITFQNPLDKNSSEAIYLFDQAAAKAGLAYHAALVPLFFRSHGFSVTVPEKDKELAQQIIDLLNPKYQHKRSLKFSGYWTEIEPTRLSNAFADHPWRFAAYRESQSDRDDELSYAAFLFRNTFRTIFGIKEWLGTNVIVGNDVLEKMAHKVVTDNGFRQSLVSDDPDLPLLWKKR